MRPNITPALRLYGRWRTAALDRQDPVLMQEHQLLRLVRKARNTLFGTAHHFSSIRDVQTFQARVPLRRYEEFWHDWWQSPFPRLRNVSWPGIIPTFAATSGTTAGVTKYIPVSPAMMASNRKAALDILVWHLHHHPASKVAGGKNLVLGGSTELRALAPGIRVGDLSGIAAREVPLWARPFYYPPSNIALIGDWERKLEILGPRSLVEDVRSISGTTSWLLQFFERVAALRPDSGGHLAALYPGLEMVVHGGVAFAPYAARFASILDGSRIDLREVYPASEGFIAVQDGATGQGLRLNLDHGLFYEFVPVTELDAPTPQRFWLGDVQTDVNYAVVVTTCAGLWAFVLGDTVRFVSTRPPRVVVSGRTSYSLSAFGEHLIGEEIERAVAEAARIIGRDITDYTVGALYPEKPGQRGGHLFVVEFTDGPPPDQLTQHRFAQAVDETLARLNVDYKDHRVPGVGMEAPRLAAVAPGTFHDWMARRGKLGGQNKVPRVINDPDLFRDIRTFAGGGQPVDGTSG